MSGAEIESQRYGEHSDEVWDEVRDVEKLKSTIRASATRDMENLVLASSNEELHTALLVSPMIYGEGRGPLKRISIQAPDMARAIFKDGHGFRFNAGLNRWSTVHVGELGGLVSRLVESGPDKETSIILPATGVVVSQSHRKESRC